MVQIPTQGVPSGSTAVKWWLCTVVPNSPKGNVSALAYQVVSAPNAAVAKANVTQQGFTVTKVGGPFATKQAAQAAGAGAQKATAPPGAQLNIPNPLSVLNPSTWLSGLGGLIGSGIESGIVSMLKDLWDVIVGPVEILIGSLIAIFVLAIYFRDDIGGIIGTVAMAAA
jgi:hypothetical protein